MRVHWVLMFPVLCFDGGRVIYVSCFSCCPSLAFVVDPLFVSVRVRIHFGYVTNLDLFIGWTKRVLLMM